MTFLKYKTYKKSLRLRFMKKLIPFSTSWPKRPNKIWERTAMVHYSIFKRSVLIQFFKEKIWSINRFNVNLKLILFTLIHLRKLCKSKTFLDFTPKSWKILYSIWNMNMVIRRLGDEIGGIHEEWRMINKKE